MNRIPGAFGQIVLLVLSITWVAPAGAGTLRCPPDSVRVGDACIDLYEESVWQIPPSNTTLTRTRHPSLRGRVYVALRDEKRGYLRGHRRRRADPPLGS